MMVSKKLENVVWMIQEFYLDYLNVYQLEKEINRYSIQFQRRVNLQSDNFFTMDTGLDLLDMEIVGNNGFGC